MTAIRRSLSERLWSRVAVGTPEQCWEWLGATTRNGYGVLGRGRRGEGNVLAHVAAYEDKIGPVPEGHQVDHVKERGCSSTLCCNPAHLEAVTQTENLRRQAEARTACKHGHPWTPDNTRITKAGHRSCRTCHRTRVFRAKAPARLVAS